MDLAEVLKEFNMIAAIGLRCPQTATLSVMQMIQGHVLFYAWVSGRWGVAHWWVQLWRRNSE